MAKRTDNRRRKQRVKIVQDMTQKLLDNLARLSENKTPPEIVKAHTEYYEQCNNAEKIMLLEIFKKGTDIESTNICNYFAEKR